MTREQVAEILLMLMSCLRLTRPVPDEKLHLDGWHAALHDVPHELAQRAAHQILREDQYLPEPSRVRELALQGILRLPDADQAWRAIEDAKSNGRGIRALGHSDAAIKALLDAVDALGGMYVLRTSETPARDRERFYKLWPDIRRRYLSLAWPEVYKALTGEDQARALFGVGAEQPAPLALPDPEDAERQFYERQAERLAAYPAKRVPRSILTAGASPAEVRDGKS